MSVFHKAAFYTTVNRIADLPPANGIEIAFAGRSNAGKSSAINSLARQGRLAFVSKTPGRTQHINFYQLGGGRFLVDLPGYGYARVPAPIRNHWRQLISTYLQTRTSLHGMVLIMDARHPLTPLDRQMLAWYAATQKPVHILLAKSDKLSRQQAENTLKEVGAFLAENYPQCTVQLFSSLTGKGVDEASAVLCAWLGMQPDGIGLGGMKTQEMESGAGKNPVKPVAKTPEIKNPRLKGNKTGGKLP
ncbi:MAG TPA: ribosome biogenesis GTP-binding protein YihA/YsxC [Nitrosospira sp.]|nr:ribosome biogenesis GTP-binding protein YihA/YsxC [Nitrosospira sp.]